MSNTLAEAERWKAIAIKNEEGYDLLEAKYEIQKDLLDSYRNLLADAKKDYEDLTEKFLALEREYNEVVKAGHVWCKSHSKIVADRDKWKCSAIGFEKYVNEAISEANEHYYFLRTERKKNELNEKKITALIEENDQLNKEYQKKREQLNTAYKKIYQQLTLLQENGLAEYGN